ncbi:MAG TPA: GGDEF domain-containing protein [Pseudobdellovibrionaceae bacterium]|nr:GGDEF domain-containing protein [Pseudobdellovibrionaceae bacterium]
MLTLEQKKQFTIFVFDKNLNTGPSTKVALVQSGFDAQFFNESGSIKAQVESNVPHIIIIDIGSLDETLSEFISFFNRISSEIQFVFIADFNDYKDLISYKEYGLIQVVSKDLGFFEDRMVYLIERACECIFLRYQNEQIYKELQRVQLENGTLRGKSTQLDKNRVNTLKIQDRLNEYRSAESLEILVQRFLGQFQGRLVIYFKYIEAVRSLLALNAQGVEISKLAGLGLQVEVKDLQIFYDQLLLGLAPSKVISEVSELFGSTKLKSFPIYVFEKLQGFFITVDEDLEIFESDLSLVSLAYSHLSLEKRLDALEVRDLLTGLLNRKSYLSKLNEEVARTVRKKIHFSVIKIAIDRLDIILKDYGEIIRDESLKLVGFYLQKLCRLSDEIYRTDFNEFAVFLPDTTKEEASVLSERIRKYFISHSLEDKGFQSSLSFGISEYPLLAQTVDAIDSSSTKALLHIQEQGGNKICFFKKPSQ